VKRYFDPLRIGLRGEWLFRYSHRDSSSKFNSVGSFTGNWRPYGLNLPAGTNLLSVNHSNALNLSNTITCEMFTRINAWNSLGGLFLKHDAGGGSQLWGFQQSNSSNQIWFTIDTYTSGFNPASSFSVGRWIHWVGTYDRSQVRIFRDGKLQSSIAHTSAIPTNASHNLRFGQWVGTSFPSNMDIAFARVWSRALKTSEIYELYRKAFSVTHFVPLLEDRVLMNEV